MAFSPPEYCRLFAQKKAYQGGITGTPGAPLATPMKKNVRLSPPLACIEMNLTFYDDLKL